MKRLLRIGIVSLAAVVVLFTAFHFIRAQGKAPAFQAGSKTLPPAPKFVMPLTAPKDPVGHFLISNIFTQDFPEVEIYGGEAGYVQLEPQPVYFRCTLPCTLEINQNVNVGLGEDPDNWLYLSYVLDDQWSGWTAVDSVLEDGAWVEGTWDQTVSLRPGRHWIVSFVDTDDPAGLYYYHNNYRIYYP
jgi:hypothetical protein